MQRGLLPAVTFEEVAVYFSPEEWAELAPWQRELHREVMGDNFDLVASLDPNSKLTHMKDESCGRMPCARGHGRAPDTTDTRTWGASDSKDDAGGHWDMGYGAPRSGWRDPEPGGCAGSALLTGSSRGLSSGAEALRAHPGRPYLCGTCGRSFRHRRSLLAHKKLRGGLPARHGCAECGRTFCLLGDLLRHRDSRRERPRGYRRFPGAAEPCDEQPFVCDRCGRSFSWRESLALHLRGHRAPERAHPCPECGRTFHRRCYLRLHRRVHSGQRPFLCSRCGRSFVSKANLSTHRRTRRRCRPRSRDPRGDGDPPGDTDREPRGDGDSLRDRDREPRGDGDPPGDRDREPRGDGDPPGDRDREPRGDGDSLRDRELLKDRHPRGDGNPPGDTDRDPRGDKDPLRDRGLLKDRRPRRDGDLLGDRDSLRHRGLLRDGEPLRDRDSRGHGDPFGDRDPSAGDQQ